MRFYFSTFAGAGTEDDPFRPVARSVAALDALDGREYPEIEDGWCLCWGEPSQSEHDALLVTAGVTYLPFEQANGTALGLDDPLSLATASNLEWVKDEMEARHVPTDGITTALTLRAAMRMVFRRIRLREVLFYIDFGRNAFTQTIADIPLIPRKALTRRLQNYGFDLSGIDGTTTIRAAINELLQQDVPVLNTPI